jgi:hypothetical protein
MARLALLALLPQLGGLVLMVSKGKIEHNIAIVSDTVLPSFAARVRRRRNSGLGSRAFLRLATGRSAWRGPAPRISFSRANISVSK